MTEQEVLFPDGKEVTIKGEVYCIKPMNIRQTLQGLKVAKNVVPEITRIISDKKLNTNTKIAQELLVLLTESGDDVFEFMTISTCIESSIIEELLIDDFYVLCLAVWEVNKDFFVQRVMPMFQENQELQQKKITKTRTQKA